MFSVTGALVTLLAAGLAASAVQQLSNAGLLNIWDTRLWDTSWLLSQDSWSGRVLHVLIGYVDRPTGMQLLAYALTALTIFGLAYSRRAPPVSRQNQSSARA
jgi:high-affinity iron transporter